MCLLLPREHSLETQVEDIHNQQLLPLCLIVIVETKV